MQGDFTLSNIVIDAEDRAKIIDINRRGCPVGWEPPEVAALIESKQRISMYIGVKSDIFQLGMVLWAIAMEQDEPEVQKRPLTLASASNEIPSYYRAIVGICLSDDPRRRCHATALLGMFPDTEDDHYQPLQYHQGVSSDHYIDPTTAVGREDIDNFSRTSVTHTYVNPPTDMSGEPYYYLNHQHSVPGNIAQPIDVHREVTDLDQRIDDSERSYRQYHETVPVADDDGFVFEGRRGRSPSPRSATGQLPQVESMDRSEETDNLNSSNSTTKQEGPSQPLSDSLQGLNNLKSSHDEKLLARVITASPSRHHALGSAEYVSAFPPNDSTDTAERLRGPEPVPTTVPELIGIGDHSEIRHSVYPRAVLDDDSTRDTQ